MAELTRDEMVGLVRAMGPAIRERAVKYDLEASFPHENFADFRGNGLLGVSIPSRYGGLGASYADYVRVSEEVGRHCGATGLTFNMHNATMLWCGQVSDLLDMTPEQRERHEETRTAMYRGVVERGDIHSQPFSEGLAPGATAGVATRAVPVDGGWLVTGRKIFASLSGAATFYNVTCQVPGEDEIRLLGVPSDGEGVEIVDDWDPLGMRGTVSRTLLMKDVFVPHANEWMPAGMYNQAANRYPWLFLSHQHLERPGGVAGGHDRRRPVGGGHTCARPHREPERASLTRHADESHRATHQFGEALGDGEPESGAGVLARRQRIALGEPCEEALLHIGVDAHSGVLHLEAEIERRLVRRG
jgi:hypothetical protein